VWIETVMAIACAGGSSVGTDQQRMVVREFALTQEGAQILLGPEVNDEVAFARTLRGGIMLAEELERITVLGASGGRGPHRGRVVRGCIAAAGGAHARRHSEQ